MTTPSPTDQWFKSSRSSENANCVEVRLAPQVGVRDTKHRNGGQLELNEAQWKAFVAAVRSET